jgi:FG-GAP-like repeat
MKMSPHKISMLLGALLTLVVSAAATVSFYPQRSYTAGTNPKAVVVGDFNHDGKRDLAVVNYGDPTTGDSGSVSILFGNGDGTFQAAKNVAIGKNCTSVVAGDFNADGNDDLALVRPGDSTVNDDGDVTIFLGNGDGTFRQGQVLAPGKNPSSTRTAIITADLNSDQRLDLMVASAGDQTFSVLLGNGDGTFQSPVAYPVDTNTLHFPISLIVVDLAGNGEKDLAVFRLFHMDLWLANGDGTFRQGGGLVVTGVTAGDFNGDKKDDLVAHTNVICIFHPCGGGPIPSNLYLGNGDGTFQPAIGIGQPASAAGDFDGDGKLDLAGTNTGSNGSAQILVLLGNGDGTFQQPITVNSNGTLSQVLDVNGDTAPDLVLIGNNSIGLQLNVGTDFSISASALSSKTLGPGQSATSTISLNLLSLFDNPVSLACSVQPAQAGAPTCSLSSTSVIFDGSGQASATLTINSSSGVASRNSFQSFSKTSLWFPVASFAFFGTSLGLSRKRRVLAVLIGAVLFIGLIAQMACGGGSGGPKSTAYTVTVTGTSGATQHSSTVNLTVQ